MCREIRLLFNDSLVGFAKSMDVRSDKKIVFNLARFEIAKIKDMFSRGFFHIAAQKYPFQIEIVEEDGKEIKIPNAWITAQNFTYHTDNWIIVEGMELEVESLPEISDQATGTKMSQSGEGGVDSTGHSEDS